MLSSNGIIGWIISYSERALKIKEVPKEVLGYLNSNMNFANLNSTIICDLPNKSIYNFNGKLRMGHMKEIYLSPKQLLWRGSTLSTTRWAIGAVVYAGMESKIMLNQGFFLLVNQFLNLLLLKHILITLLLSI